MRTEQLEYVAAIARHGSFRRAAEALRISQPALSTAVRNLERELGVELFERGRGGARISATGAELMPALTAVIEDLAVLRRAAGSAAEAGRMLRVGTVNAGTVPLLAPAIAAFRAAYPGTQVEVVGAQESQIDEGLREGSLDLGLVTSLDGDDPPPEFETVRLLAGRPVVCLRADDPLAAQASIGPEQLLDAPLIVMRAGYVMHRFLHRYLDDRVPDVSTDGAEMGKVMVAEGLGITVLPDFSVAGDPLERAGVIAARPLRGTVAGVSLGLRRHRSDVSPRAARALHAAFVERAAAVREGGPA